MFNLMFLGDSMMTTKLTFCIIVTVANHELLSKTEKNNNTKEIFFIDILFPLILKTKKHEQNVTLGMRMTQVQYTILAEISKLTQISSFLLHWIYVEFILHICNIAFKDWLEIVARENATKRGD